MKEIITVSKLKDYLEKLVEEGNGDAKVYIEYPRGESGVDVGVTRFPGMTTFFPQDPDRKHKALVF